MGAELDRAQEGPVGGPGGGGKWLQKRSGGDFDRLKEGGRVKMDVLGGGGRSGQLQGGLEGARSTERGEFLRRSCTGKRIKGGKHGFWSRAGWGGVVIKCRIIK